MKWRQVAVMSCAAILGTSSAAEAQRIVLEGRESVEAMKQFDPFLGRWRRIESPRGTPISEDRAGGCVFEKFNQGISVRHGCGPWDAPAESGQVFWHPLDRKLIFRLYSVFFPDDLLFEGEYVFPEPGRMERMYRGIYGDGRIEVYRDVWTLEGPDRLHSVTEALRKREWVPLFDGSLYRRIVEAVGKA
jgi:hypothetical protein